jgi:hypothetical protein
MRNLCFTERSLQFSIFTHKSLANLFSPSPLFFFSLVLPYPLPTPSSLSGLHPGSSPPSLSSMPQQAGLTSGGGRAARVRRALARGGAATVGGPERRPQGQARVDGGSGPAQTLGRSAQTRSARTRGAGARQARRCAGAGVARATGGAGGSARRQAERTREALGARLVARARAARAARPEQEQLGWRASAGRLAGGTGRVDARELRRWSGAGGEGVEQ